MVAAVVAEEKYSFAAVVLTWMTFDERRNDLLAVL